MRTSNSTSVEMQSLSKKHLIFFLILFSLLLCMFLWSYFIFPLITVFSPPPNLTCITQQYKTLNTFIFHCLLVISVCYLCCAPYRSIRTPPYVPSFLSVVMHLYATSFHLLHCCWHSFFHFFFFFFFFLEVPSQYLLQQWPIFPTGIIKTSSRYLYTYTNLLPSSSPSHLSPNSPWSFSPQRLFFSHRVSTVV